MISEETKDIFGHEKEEAALAAAIVNNRIFPTWIFHGPSGIGKASIAVKFAKCLLSGIIPEREGNSLNIDLDNDIHKLVDLRTHPDFFILEQSDESISIDDTRKLLLKVRKSPALSKRRVVILENSSSFNKNIYNSLLKMLEEPPRDTVIIMICNHTGTMPETLLSRAAKVRFNSLNKDLVQHILDQKGIKNAKELAKLSEGSIGYAIYLSENNGIEIYKNILKGFFYDGSCYQKTLKWIIDNNLCDKFQIIKTSILRILRIYINILSGIEVENSTEEIEILGPIANVRRNFLDYEIKKNQEILFMLNICESAMLDKNAVVVDTFERFFG
jgi:hypothetical protein